MPKSFDESRLGEAGDADQQGVPAAQQGDQGLLDHLALTKDDFADPLADEAEASAQRFDFGDEIGRGGVDGCSGGQADRFLFKVRYRYERDTKSPAIGNSSPITAAPGSKRPPIDCGDLEMRIARDGTWFYRGSPIGRLALVKLFASVLRREVDGRYWLVTPAERGLIEVEDAPFLAVELSVASEGR